MLTYPTPPKGGGLYVIWIGPYYYGGRTVSFKARWRAHLRRLEAGRHKNPKMQAVFNKYRGFLPVVIERIEEPTSQREVEQGWLDEHVGRTACLNLNRSADGRMSGYQHSASTKRRMSKSQKKRMESPEVREKIAASLRGRTLSEEHRQAISEGNKGKKLSPEHVEVLRECNRNRDWTPEMREKHSEIHMGHVRSEESKRKQAKTIKNNPELMEKARASLARNGLKKGYKASEEHRRNIAEARRGSKVSPEGKANMSKAQQARRKREDPKRAAEIGKKIGDAMRGRVTINNGSVTRMVFPEEAASLLGNGEWVRGKLSRRRA